LFDCTVSVNVLQLSSFSKVVAKRKEAQQIDLIMPDAPSQKRTELKPTPEFIEVS